eukprot:4610606-Pleurochrysis_carterae.AAC.1
MGATRRLPAAAAPTQHGGGGGPVARGTRRRKAGGERQREHAGAEQHGSRDGGREDSPALAARPVRRLYEQAHAAEGGDGRGGKAGSRRRRPSTAV